MAIRVALILMLIFPLTVVAWAEHLPWMDGKMDARGISCCSDLDCLPADVQLLHPHGELLVNGEPVHLDPGSIHQVPLDVPTGFWCWRGNRQECQPPTLEISERCGRCAFFQIRHGEG